jgi:UDP-3-O-[3-hydroxymyristoyl] glucosamine N-acyltransferase
VTTKKATLKKDCTYSAKVTVQAKATMKATARFGGNSVVDAKSSAAPSVRAG